MLIDYMPIIIAIIGGVFGLTSLIIQARRDRSKVNADTATTYEALTARQSQRIAEQDARIDKLEARVRESEDELEALRSGVALLVNQLKANGHTPVWTPAQLKAAKS
jgi:uncharacterized coiled-coil protein SlyX